VLVQREVLEREADPRSPERGQYAFVQGLVQEVAYGTLGRADRQSRHLAAARYYESVGDDELAAVLASPPTRPGDTAGAADARSGRVALAAAGDRASLLPHAQARGCSDALLRDGSPSRHRSLSGPVARHGRSVITPPPTGSR
jgi:hypothetical protein